MHTNKTDLTYVTFSAGRDFDSKVVRIQKNNMNGLIEVYEDRASAHQGNTAVKIYEGEEEQFVEKMIACFKR